MRSLLAAATAASLILSLAAPAEARHRRHRDRDVDAGDVVAGALLVGGIAALASSIGEGRRRKQDMAVEICSAEAAARLGGPIEGIFHVGRRNGYYRVEGAVDRGDGPAHFTCTVRGRTLYGFRTEGEY